LSIVGSRRPAPSPTWGVGTTFPSAPRSTPMICP
jgi:hypothetical protein